MFSTVSNNVAAAVAAVFSAAVFISASVGPAINTAATVVA